MESVTTQREIFDYLTTQYDDFYKYLDYCIFSSKQVTQALVMLFLCTTIVV